MQDVESAIAGHGLYIRYDSVENDAVKKKLIGQSIVDAFTAAGLKTDWNGDPDAAVGVRMKWRKRRKDKLPKRK